jgi:hypothetical protein
MTFALRACAAELSGGMRGAARRNRGPLAAGGGAGGLMAGQDARSGRLRGHDADILA